jgi:hypothetical protein
LFRGKVEYLCHKLELNDFSGVGLDAIWRESERAVETDLDDVHLYIGLCDGCSSEEECGDEGVEKLHFE